MRDATPCPSCGRQRPCLCDAETPNRAPTSAEVVPFPRRRPPPPPLTDPEPPSAA